MHVIYAMNPHSKNIFNTDVWCMACQAFLELDLRDIDQFTRFTWGHNFKVLIKMVQ